MKKYYVGMLSTLVFISCKPAQDKANTQDSAPTTHEQQATQTPTQTETKPWELPTATPEGSQAELVLYGEEVITHTAQYIGPQAENTSQRFAGNNLSCKNCHLQAGKQANAIGFVGVASRYPRFRGRENREANLKERINGCMERSLNGKPLPMDSREMNAMIAYMEWLSQDIPKGINVKGMGTPKLELLDRAADPVKGKVVFDNKCSVCHQSKGQGLPLNPQDLSKGYTFPPLWGPDSFNNGAGMHRVITSAQYIKANMPLGAADLSTEEAFDVAAFINSQERPIKSNLEMDYPERSLKPIDSPYPPFADQFPAKQHKYGPFKPLQVAKKTE